jgi:DNA-binding NtrC family response regulator
VAGIQRIPFHRHAFCIDCSVIAIERAIAFRLAPYSTLDFAAIVEDEDQVRVLADSYLQQQGHKTFSASTIDGALALLDGDQDIDLLFVDISLHDDIRAGLELAKQAAERRPELKVLYTTGAGITDGMRARFVQNWAFLPKPYTVDPTTTAAIAQPTAPPAMVAC